MRDVHHNTHAVHFFDHLPTKWTKAIPGSGCIVGRVANQVVLAVRQCDITNTTLVEICDILEVVTNRGAIFHTHWQRNNAFFEIAQRLFGRSHHLEFIRMRFGNASHHIDQGIGKFLGAAGFLVARWNVNGHKRYIQTAFLSANVVEITIFCFNRDSDKFFSQSEIPGFQAIRQIHVPVGNDIFMRQFVGDFTKLLVALSRPGIRVLCKYYRSNQ